VITDDTATAVHVVIFPEDAMPERETLKRALANAREGKAATTQAGEFVREKVHHVREGKHGASSTKQVIAIGLSKARRAEVPLPPPKGAGSKLRAQAQREIVKVHSRSKPSTARSRATLKAL
jgi:hypothetical protein